MDIFYRGTTGVQGTGIIVGGPFNLDTYVCDDQMVATAATECPEHWNMPGYHLVTVELFHYVATYGNGDDSDVGAMPDICRANCGFYTRWVSQVAIPPDFQAFSYKRSCLMHTAHTMQNLYEAIASVEGWPMRNAEVSLADYGQLDDDETLLQLITHANDNDEFIIPIVDWPSAEDCT